MIDRRLVTDFALAVLIALPAILPAAPSPWSVNSKAGYPAPETSDAAAPADQLASAGAAKWHRAQPERSS